MNIVLSTLPSKDSIFAFADDGDRMVGSAFLRYTNLWRFPIAVIESVRLQDGYIGWKNASGETLDSLLVSALIDANIANKGTKKFAALTDLTKYQPMRKRYEESRAAVSS